MIMSVGVEEYLCMCLHVLDNKVNHISPVIREEKANQ